MKLGPRYSLPFVCKTDIDLIKEMNGEAFQDRRISLLMMNERNRTRHSMVEETSDRNVQKKYSTNSLKEGKQYERRLAHMNADDTNQVSRMASLPVKTEGNSDTCDIPSINNKLATGGKLKGISTSHVL